MKIYRATKNAVFGNIASDDIIVGCRTTVTHEDREDLVLWIFVCKKGVVKEWAYDWEFCEIV